MARVTDEQILEAGIRTFGSVGYHQASMAAIAIDAGTTKPTLYAHFGDKDGLLAASLAHERTILLDHLFLAYDRASHLPQQQQIASDVAAIFDYARLRPHGFALLFGERAGDAVEQTRREIVRRVEERIAAVFVGWADAAGVSSRLGVGEHAVALLASLSVATSLRGAADALGRPTAEVEAINAATASFVISALRHLDGDAFAALDS